MLKAPAELPDLPVEKRFRFGKKGERKSRRRRLQFPAQLERAREPVVTVGGWQIPPVDVLDKPKEIELNREEMDKRARLIEEALDSYGVEAKVVQINAGPTVTQFGVEPGWLRKFRKVVDDVGEERQEETSRTRIRVDRITALSNDLALALAAPSIRIEAPIPGKSMVGIEVPNSAFGAVSLRSVIESSGLPESPGEVEAGDRTRQGRRGRVGDRGPVQDAAPAHRRLDRQRQDRLPEFHHLLPAHAQQP